MKPDGIVWERAHDGREQPLSQDVINLLRETHQKQAKSKSRRVRRCMTFALSHPTEQRSRMPLPSILIMRAAILP